MAPSQWEVMPTIYGEIGTGSGSFQCRRMSSFTCNLQFKTVALSTPALSCHSQIVSVSVPRFSWQRAMPEEAADFARATRKRNQLDPLTNEKKLLKKALEKRDNDEVLQRLESMGGDKEENYWVFSLQNLPNLF